MVAMRETKTRNKYYNPNPKKVETSDCVVRALCKATGKDWDTVFEELIEIGREHKVMPHSDEAWKMYVEQYGFIKHSIKVVKGQRRLRVDGFARTLGKKGTFLLNVANHLVTSVDGYYYDTWDCGDKMVYNYFEYIGGGK